MFNCFDFLFVIVERKDEGTVLEHSVFRMWTWCKYVSDQKDSRSGCKRDSRDLKRRALDAFFRYYTYSLYSLNRH